MVRSTSARLTPPPQQSKDCSLPSVGGGLCSVRGELVDKRITSNVTDLPSKENDVHSQRISIPEYSRVFNIYRREETWVRHHKIKLDGHIRIRYVLQCRQNGGACGETNSFEVRAAIKLRVFVAQGKIVRGNVESKYGHQNNLTLLAQTFKAIPRR